MEASDIIPAEHLILRKYIAVMNDFFMCHPNFLIHIIRNQHVYFRICIHKSLHCTQYLQQSLFIYPVITVHYFKIDTCGMRQTCIDRIPVTAVFLVYRFDDPRIFFLVFFCNLACPVWGSVINYNNLHIFSSGQDRLNCFFHICLWIIAWNCKRYIFHVYTPFLQYSNYTVLLLFFQPFYCKIPLLPL